MANDRSSRSFGKFLVDCAYSFISFAVLVMLMWAFVFSFVLRTVEVDGPSMQDTLQNGQRMILLSVGYTPKRGDIVVCNRLDSEKTKLAYGVSTYKEPIIKRVIGLPGDVVEISKDAVKVNGVKLDEPYVHYPNTVLGEAPSSSYFVPEGEVFVMGDHRNNSSDSRFSSIGTIKMENIMGHVVARMNSITDFDVMKSVSYADIPDEPTMKMKAKAMEDAETRKNYADDSETNVIRIKIKESETAPSTTASKEATGNEE